MHAQYIYILPQILRIVSSPYINRMSFCRVTELLLSLPQGQMELLVFLTSMLENISETWSVTMGPSCASLCLTTAM